MFLFLRKQVTCEDDKLVLAGVAVVKHLPANAGDKVLILWGRKWQPAPVFWAWEIPWTEEPDGYSPL